MTKILKCILISCFLLLIIANAFATTVKGCRINNQDFIYNQYLNEQEYVVSQWYKPRFNTYSQSSTAQFLQAWYNPNNCPRFVTVSIGSPQCAVQGISYANSSGVFNLGNTVTYTLEYQNCSPNPVGLPLDDYILFLLIAGIAFGSYFILEKKEIFLQS